MLDFLRFCPLILHIIPYIDDYRVAVSLDLYDYTGINFNVDVKTAEGDDEEDEDSTKLDIVVNKIAEELIKNSSKSE